MSKHKHFYNIKNPMQMLQYARRERIGPMDPGRTQPKRKTAPGVTSTQDGKAEKIIADQISASTITEKRR